MLKRFGLWLLATFFTFCVLIVAVSAATNSVFGSSGALKGSLAESGVYGTTADAIIDQAVESFRKPPEGEASRRGEGDLQLDPKLTEKVARKVVTPDKLQGYAEQIVDGTYNWLEGEVQEPNYSIDTGAIKQDLANAVGDTATERVEGLPVCTLAQLQQLQASEFDPFTVPCRPPGINLKAERAKLVKEITKNKELLDDGQVTAEDTKAEGSQKTAFEQLAYVPTIFQWSQKLPWILGVFGLVTAVAYLYLHDDRRKAGKKIAIILLVSGILLLIGIWLATALFGSIRFDGPDDRMRETFVGIIRALNADFNDTLRIFAIVYAVLGVAGLVALRFIKPAHAESKPDSPEEKPVEHKKSETTEPKNDSKKP